MKALSLIGTLFFVLAANSTHADVIRPHTVAPASIKAFEYKGQKATVSANVPKEVYGEYRLHIASGRATVASRTITLNQSDPYLPILVQRCDGSIPRPAARIRRLQVVHGLNRTPDQATQTHADPLRFQLSI